MFVRSKGFKGGWVTPNVLEDTDTFDGRIEEGGGKNVIGKKWELSFGFCVLRDASIAGEGSHVIKRIISMIYVS